MKKDIQQTLDDRYLLTNEKTWNDLSARVAGIYPPAKDLLHSMRFIPSSPTLMNGNSKGEVLGTLSSCFTMGIEDTLTDIMKSFSEAAIVTKMCGGVGYNFTKLRSKIENITSLGRNSSGVIPFIGILNATLDGIRQGGRRKGAGMAQLEINHGDILDFIRHKRDPSEKKLQRMNLSVRIPDWFYDKLEKEPHSAMSIKNVATNQETNLIEDDKIWTIEEVWKLIIKCAWESGDPGIFNSDIAFRQCTVTNLSKEVFSNPCQEYISIPYGSCNLGSMNLTKYVKNGHFDWGSFGTDIEIAVHFLNKVIDLNTFPIKKIEDTTKKIRPIGLGFMGLAHALVNLGFPYNSKESLAFAGAMTRFLTIKAMRVSCDLAKKHGAAYPAYDEKLFFKANERFFKIEEEICGDVNVNELKKDIIKYGIYNSCFTSIAPTGSIGFIADVTSGIEPIFALAYTRNIEEGIDKKGKNQYRSAYIIDSCFEAFLDKNYPKEKERILEEVASEEFGGSCKKSKYLTPEEKELFTTATDLTPLEHVDMLGVVARNTSLSVSKTINLPEEATYKDIADVYRKAHKEGIIGVTVFREGCRDDAILTTSSSKTKIMERPQEVPAEVHTFVIKKHCYFVVVGLNEKFPFEVFTGSNYDDDGDMFIPRDLKKGRIVKEKSGSYSFVPLGGGEKKYQLTSGNYHVESSAEALTRQMSLALQSGAHIAAVVDQLEKTREMNSFARAVARALKTYIKNGTKVKAQCPDCHQQLVRIDGCPRCPACGFSNCH